MCNQAEDTSQTLFSSRVPVSSIASWRAARVPEGEGRGGGGGGGEHHTA